MASTIKLNQNKTKMIAHRGLSSIECQNTCSAFVAAGNHSYYGIESDVHKTADGVFVMIHDNDTRFVCDQVLNIEESNYADLAALNFRAYGVEPYRKDLKIPTLEEYIRICACYEKKAVLETKIPLSHEDLKRIVELITEYGYLDNTVFISFAYDHLCYLRELLPNHPMQFLTGECHDELLQELIAHRFGLDIYHPGLTDEAIATMHAAGLPVNCWTVDDAAIAMALVERGVDFITTDFLE